ncbi:MAG: hypothetical protein DRN20_03780 [Thermoplasmata archaeon]|nr:MAG: hypothetical protein DRN20_03780 [Thermoplasmata archaeon]
MCTQDYEGDLRAGWRTVPVRIGPDRAMKQVPFYYLGYLLLFIPWIKYPKYMSDIYLMDALMFVVALYTLWYLNYRAYRRIKDKERLNRAFELYTRTMTRIFIILFELLLVFEGLWDIHIIPS